MFQLVRSSIAFSMKRQFDDLTFEKFEKIDFRDKLSRKDEKWRELNGGAR